MMKIGMVCEGGANRTIFSCGVWDALLEQNVMPDYFVGVSAGIAFGVSYLSKQRERNLELMEKYMADKRYMGMQHLLNPKERAFYNMKFVFEEIPNELLPFDYEAFGKFSGKVEATVTNVHTGEAEYLVVPRGRDMRDTLVASCSLPLMFQPIRIGKHVYLDGGVSDSLPFMHAFEEGCDKVIVVLTRERDYVKKTEKGSGFVGKLYRKYPKIVEAMETRPQRYNESVEQLKQLEAEGKVFVIAPESTLGVGRTEKNTMRLRQLYEEGLRIGRECLPELMEFIK